MYTPKTLKHFKKPHNYGKIKNPDGIGKVGNIICGDVMWLYIKIGKNKKVPPYQRGVKKGGEIIKDVKFETFGCVAAIAASSVITDLAKGKTIKDALKITREKVVNSLGGLPPIKIHCSILAVDALVEAIYDYLSKNKKRVPEKLKQQHQRINRERKLIEKKYKDFL